MHTYVKNEIVQALLNVLACCLLACYDVRRTRFCATACIVVRRFIARRRAEQMRQRRALLSVPAKLDSDDWNQQLGLLTADDWTRQNSETDEDCDLVDTCQTDKQSCCVFTGSRLIDSPGCPFQCNISGTASDEDHPECAKSEETRGACTDAVTFSAVAAALRSGCELRVESALPNLPFIEVFDGVISRRAVLKVSS